LVGGDPVLMSQREKLILLTRQYSLPAIYDRREYAEVGGLVSYGTSLSDPHRKIGLYASRILHGEKPADLPVQRSTKFELVINLKTAKVLGLDIPPHSTRHCRRGDRMSGRRQAKLTRSSRWKTGPSTE
jgi:putative ABC transport system substrate-binding protein